MRHRCCDLNQQWQSPPLHNMERRAGGEVSYLRPGWAWLCLLIPLVAIGLQPLINLILTGSPVASGNVAKSLFGMVPFDPVMVGGRIWDNFWQMWWGFFNTANSPVTVGAATMVLAGFGFDALFEPPRRRHLSEQLRMAETTVDVTRGANRPAARPANW